MKASHLPSGLTFELLARHGGLSIRRVIRTRRPLPSSFSFHKSTSGNWLIRSHEDSRQMCSLSGQDSFAFVMRQYLINIGDDINIFQVYAARNCLPVAPPVTAADVFLEYELGVLVPEDPRLGPALLCAAVNNTVISDTWSAVRSVTQINDMALEIINRIDTRFMPAMRGVSEAIGQRGNRCTFLDLAPDRLWRTCRIFVHDPDFKLQVPAGMPVLEHLRPDQEIIAIGQKQHPQKRMVLAEHPWSGCALYG